MCGRYLASMHLALLLMLPICFWMWPSLLWLPPVYLKTCLISYKHVGRPSVITHCPCEWDCLPSICYLSPLLNALCGCGHCHMLLAMHTVVCSLFCTHYVYCPIELLCNVHTHLNSMCVFHPSCMSSAWCLPMIIYVQTYLVFSSAYVCVPSIGMYVSLAWSIMPLMVHEYIYILPTYVYTCIWLTHKFILHTQALPF